MQKIKITVEQKEALESYKNEMGKDGLNGVEYRSENQLLVKEWASLNKYKLDQLSLLLHGWYEVEQPFKVGDWVKGKVSGEYAKLARKSEGSFRVIYTDDKADLYANSDFDKYFEKVTELWKIMLLELGRGKPEFHKNDIIVTESEVYEAEYLTDEEIIVLFEKDLVRAFHAAEHRIEVKGHDS